MRKFLFFFVVVLVSLFFVNARMICIDLDAPGEPRNLSASVVSNKVFLMWDDARDIPNCSGISRYVVERDGKVVMNANETFFIDEVNYSTYYYSVYAIDRAGNVGKRANVSVRVVEGVPYSGGAGGSRGSSYICVENWTCSNWSECMDNYQMRFCYDRNNCTTYSTRPSQFRICESEQVSQSSAEKVIEGAKEEGLKLSEDNKNEGFLLPFTGAVVGTLRSPIFWIVFTFIFLVVVSYFISKFMAKGKKNVKKSKK